MIGTIFAEIERRIERADFRYGDFTSTHEAMGVALEEWDELRAAIKANSLIDVDQEAIDLAAVLIRLARLMRGSQFTHERSVK